MTIVTSSVSGTDVRGTLHYAGACESRHRLDTHNPALDNVVLEPHEVLIRDVRSARDTYDLDQHGFAFVKHSSVAASDPELFDASNRPLTLPGGAQARYSHEMVELVREYTGASVVLAQLGGFMVRASRRAKTRSWAGTAGLVHLDYSPSAASQFLEWTVDAWRVPVPPHRHFAFIQTWRALSAGPQDNVLCLCDAGSALSEDVVPIDAVLGPADVPGKCFEFRLCKFRAGHSWFYLSNMELDDVVLFKGYDSRYPRAMNGMHSAFENPLAGPGAVPRRSIEARFLAFYE